MIKILQNMGIEGTLLSIVRAIYDKPKENIILNGENLKAFHLRSGTRQGVHFHHNYSTELNNNWIVEVLDTAFREEKEIKGIQIGKQEVKLSMFADDLILYIENPKDCIRKLLELII